MEDIRALKASRGAQSYEANTMATRHEMRSLCGQCHVTYYFRPPDKQRPLSPADQQFTRVTVLEWCPPQKSASGKSFLSCSAGHSGMG